MPYQYRTFLGYSVLIKVSILMFLYHIYSYMTPPSIRLHLFRSSPSRCCAERASSPSLPNRHLSNLRRSIPAYPKILSNNTFPNPSIPGGSGLLTALQILFPRLPSNQRPASPTTSPSTSPSPPSLSPPPSPSDPIINRSLRSTTHIPLVHCPAVSTLISSGDPSENAHASPFPLPPSSSGCVNAYHTQSGSCN